MTPLTYLMAGLAFFFLRSALEAALKNGTVEPTRETDRTDTACAVGLYLSLGFFLVGNPAGTHLSRVVIPALNAGLFIYVSLLKNMGWKYDFVAISGVIVMLSRLP